MRLKEIEERLSAIKLELDGEGADVDALEKEIASLKEERKQLKEKIEKRKGLIDQIAGLENPVVIGSFGEERGAKPVEFDIETVLGTPEYRSAYLKSLQGKSLTEVEQRALTTGSGATAAVPVVTENKIYDKLVQTSALYNKVTVTNIAGNVTFVVANAKNDAAFKTEGADGTAADDTVASVSLSGYELIKLVEISAAASAMTIDAFETYIVDEIGRKMSIAIENFILNGTGSAQPTGLLATGIITNTTTYTKAAMTYKDIVKILSLLPTMYHQNAVMVMPRALFFNDVIGMTSTTGEAVVVQNPQSPMQFNVLGYPVVIDDYMPTDTIVFGDFSYYKINFSQNIAIDSDKSVGFKSGKTIYRGLAVVDGKPALSEAFVKATRSAT